VPVAADESPRRALVESEAAHGSPPRSGLVPLEQHPVPRPARATVTTPKPVLGYQLVQGLPAVPQRGMPAPRRGRALAAPGFHNTSSDVSVARLSRHIYRLSLIGCLPLRDVMKYGTHAARAYCGFLA